MSDIHVHPIEASIDVSVPLYPVLVSVPVYEVDVQTAGAPGMTGPPGPPGADSTVPGPPGPPGADSTVPGPPGPPAVLPPESDAQKNTTYGLDALPTPGAAYESVAIGQNALRQATSGQGTAIGYLALGAVTAATESTAVGGQVGMLATGTALTLIGHGTGYYPVDLGASNQATLVGAYACSYTPGGGTQASALGFQSRAAIAGTALGALAQARGLYSTAVGHGAVATLDNQIMLGTAAERVYVNNDPVAALEVATKRYVDSAAPALPPETDAVGNTGYGQGTLPTATGVNNTAIGLDAGGLITTGIQNVAIGEDALYAPKGSTATATKTASKQVAVGTEAGAYGSGVGDGGVAIGHRALFHSGAIAIGLGAEARNSRSVAIGYTALATIDNQIMLGASYHRVYVNNDPVADLEVATKRYVDSKGGGGGTATISGLWRPSFPFQVLATAAMGAGSGRILRMESQQTFGTVQIEVTTLGAGALYRVGAYTDTPTGPGSLIAQTADIDASTVGVKQSALAVPSGPVWLLVQNVGPAGATLRVAAGMNPYSPGNGPMGANTMHNGWSQTGLGTSLPPVWPTAGQNQNAQCPSIFLQAV